VQIGELTLELDQGMMRTGDVASAACAGTHARCSRHHRPDHRRVLGHPEIVVGAPHNHRAGPLRRMPERVREAAGEPLEIGKYPIPALISEPAKRLLEILFVVHCGRAEALFRTLPRWFLMLFRVPCRGGKYDPWLLSELS
jgi:hypothetical protein